MTPRIRRVIAPMCFLLAAIGCNREIPYGSVEGVVTFEGKPVEDAEVIFMPDPGKGTSGPRSVALTDKNGHYRIASDLGRDGTPVGFHVVQINDIAAMGRQHTHTAGQVPPVAPIPEGNAVPAIEAPKPRSAGRTSTDSNGLPFIYVRYPNEPPEKQMKLRFPFKYSDARSSPFRDIEVKDGIQTLDFKLTAKP